MSTKSRAPQPSTAPAQQPQGPQSALLDRDADVEQANQIGNAAMAAQAGQSGQTGQPSAERGGGLLDEGLEAAEGAIEAVLDWTWEQIGCADDLRTYAEEAGLDAAIAMVFQLVQHVPSVLAEFLAEVATVDELAWVVLEAMADLAVFLELPLATQAAFLIEALHRGATWLLDALQQVDAGELLALVQQLSEDDLEALREGALGLYLNLLDAVWTPGLGVTLAIEAAVGLEVVDLSYEMSLTLRHQGQGAFEVVRDRRGGVDVGLDEGNGAEEEEAGAELKLTLGAEGFFTETYDVPFLGLGAPGLYGQLLSSLHVESAAQQLGTSFGLEDPRDYLTSFELGGGAKLSGGVGADTGSDEGASDPAGVAMKLAAAAGLSGSVEVSGIEESGCDMTLAATLEVLLQAGGALKLGEGLQAALGSFDEDVGADSELTVSWHLSVVEGEALISDVVVSRTDTVDAGRAEVGLGVEMGVEAAVPTSVEEFLARVQGLTLSASIGASDDLAAAWLEAAGLRDTLGGGTWALSATIALEASLDLDAVQFVAGVVAEALRASVAEDGLVDALLAWAACPLQSTPAEVVQLLATELAMDGDLSLTIIGEASQGAEGSVGDIEGSAEVTLDIEHDLLAMGAVVTTDHLSRVLRGDVSGARERALA